MPGYLFHLAFGEEVLKKGGIKNKEAFKLGNIAPDLAPDKMLSHFKTDNIGVFIVPCINCFIKKYSDELKKNNEFVLGVLAHIYLDYYFIQQFVSKYIVTLDNKMCPTSIPSQIKYIKLLKNNKYIDLENEDKPIEIDNFFRERILHREYSALNNHFRNDYVLQLPSADKVPNIVSEIPPKAVKKNYLELNKELTTILLTSDTSSSIFSYEDYKEFAKNLANEFISLTKNLL